MILIHMNEEKISEVPRKYIRAYKEIYHLRDVEALTKNKKFISANEFIFLPFNGSERAALKKARNRLMPFACATVKYPYMPELIDEIQKKEKIVQTLECRLRAEREHLNKIKEQYETHCGKARKGKTNDET